MSFAYLALISIIQGITEFLPVSSSGHLVLLPHLMDVQDQGMMIDIAVHFGTLLAVMIYFYKDVYTLACGGLQTLLLKRNQNTKLFSAVFLGTLPVIIIGFFLHHYIPSGIRALEIIGWTTLLFGLLLGWADKKFKTDKSCDDLSLKGVLIIGFMQVLALIPGTSRSGITITAGRFLGLNRVEASRFALLLGIPTILGASVVGFYDLYQTDNLSFQQDALIAIILSFIMAYISIWGLMKFTKRGTFMPFTIYRVLLGSGILISVYFL